VSPAPAAPDRRGDSVIRWPLARPLRAEVSGPVARLWFLRPVTRWPRGCRPAGRRGRWSAGRRFAAVRHRGRPGRGTDPDHRGDSLSSRTAAGCRVPPRWSSPPGRSSV